MRFKPEDKILLYHSDKYPLAVVRITHIMLDDYSDSGKPHEVINGIVLYSYAEYYRIGDTIHRCVDCNKTIKLRDLDKKRREEVMVNLI